MYQAEVHFLKWAKEKLKDKAWCNSQRLRKYTFGMLIQEIFGRPYDPKIDGGRLSTAHMFAHYCSRVTKCYWDWKKEITRKTPGYCISIARLKEVKPYSLRLQAEQIMEQGIVPTRYNVKFKKDLEPGHAHNYKREAVMKAKREKGKEIYERTKKKQRKSYNKSTKESN